MILIPVIHALKAITVIATKNALNYIDPLFLITWHQGITGLILITAFFGMRKIVPLMDKKSIALFVQLVLFYTGFTHIFYILALGHLSAAYATFLFSLNPFVVAIFASFILNEAFSWKKIVGLIIGFIGALPLFLLGGISLHDSVSLCSAGGLFALGSVCANSYGIVVLKQIIEMDRYSPLLINSIAMFGGSCIALIAACLVGAPAHIDQPAQFIWLLCIIVGLNNLLGYYLYMRMLKRYSATFLSFTNFMYPVFGAFFGWILLGETIGKSFVFAVCTVSFGLYIFHQEELKQQAEQVS